MSESILVIENPISNNVIVDSANTNDFSIVIENLEPNNLTIETSFIENIGLVEIERFAGPILEIVNAASIIKVTDLPDIPFSKITGNIDVSRIDNLDYYLDHYSFDCGTP